jgi:hypothetical protein
MAVKSAASPWEKSPGDLIVPGSGVVPNAHCLPGACSSPCRYLPASVRLTGDIARHRCAVALVCMHGLGPRRIVMFHIVRLP